MRWRERLYPLRGGAQPRVRVDFICSCPEIYAAKYRSITTGFKLRLRDVHREVDYTPRERHLASCFLRASPDKRVPHLLDFCVCVLLSLSMF